MCNSLKIVTTLVIVVGIQVIAAGAAVASIAPTSDFSKQETSIDPFLPSQASSSQVSMAANKGTGDFAPPPSPPPRRTQGSGTR